MQFQSFLLCRRFGNLNNPVQPTMSNVTGHVVTIYACYPTKRGFLEYVGFPRAGQNPCQRCEIIVSTNNGLRE